MNMQTSPNDLQVRIEQRLRTMRTLWGALLMSIVVYYLFTRFTEQPTEVNPNSSLSLILVAIALLTIPISFVIKKKLLTQAVAQQRVEIVQQGYIISWAITEVAALLGILDFFLTGNPYYFVLMIIAACGTLLNFPRRQHVIDALFKTRTL